MAATAPRAAGAALRDALVNARTVYLRIHPRPRTLAESRQVLRALEGHGEVVTYKNLKYEDRPMPNIAIVTFRDQQARDRCLSASPLRFTLGSPPSHLSQYSQEPAREFHVVASPSSHKHTHHMELSRFHGGFVPDLRSAMAQDLRGRTGGLVGLEDWSRPTTEPTRLRRKRQPSGAGPELMRLWEEGMREEGTLSDDRGGDENAQRIGVRVGTSQLA
ncbi:MAG: hypothetical protein M1832_003844 [Thelocarpon impressellum]|nr:MAG: hypothetical protein M1832_003844 [Thelocarpon impressellum]